ncbi:MAG: hypothetical protein VXZ72_05495, partial [Chlamydiota bacterium]|nr:hypothetical protein [Chlamydiota bacterium]
ALRPQFLSISGFKTSNTSITANIGTLSSSAHSVSLQFSDESSPPLSIVSYVPNFGGGNTGLYNVYPLTKTSGTHSVKTTIDASAFNSTGEYSGMFSGFGSNSLEIEIPITAGDSLGMETALVNPSYAYFIIAF